MKYLTKRNATIVFCYVMLTAMFFVLIIPYVALSLMSRFLPLRFSRYTMTAAIWMQNTLEDVVYSLKYIPRFNH